MPSSRHVIIGAGFAGAAAAYHLAKGGADKIVVIEQEEVPGVHSSGRNASMVRQIVPDPVLSVLVHEGAAFLQNLPSDWTEAVSYNQNGSLLLARGKELADLMRDVERARQMGILAEYWSREEAERRVEILKGADFEGAVWCPTDGVVDIHALLTAYLKGAATLGTEIRYSCPVKKIDVEEGRVTGVIAGDDWIATDVVINAAGAWAKEIGRIAGASSVPLRSLRRHLFLTPPLSWVDPSWPFVWDISHGFYFRPDSGGLLMCACDQEEMDAGSPPIDDAVVEVLAEKARLYFPEISDVPIKTCWAGLRTFSPDGRFVIGWDGKLSGFFWLAGLGGHGVTTSASCGALATNLILHGDGWMRDDFSPNRFAA